MSHHCAFLLVTFILLAVCLPCLAANRSCKLNIRDGIIGNRQLRDDYGVTRYYVPTVDGILVSPMYGDSPII